MHTIDAVHVCCGCGCSAAFGPCCYEVRDKFGRVYWPTCPRDPENEIACEYERQVRSELADASWGAR